MNRILLDISVHQTRIAVVEDGELVELQFESKNNENIIGNIYAGRICAVLPGMQAVFVDIGEEKNAFLSYSGQKPKVGQTIIVQVEKAAFGTKGAVVTTKLSFAGKFVVILPGENEIGISKKITDTTERERIKGIVQNLLGNSYGIIIRTNGIGKSEQDYRIEIERLISLYQKVLKNAQFSVAPMLIYRDSLPVLKAVRDLFTNKIDEFVVNDEAVYKELIENGYFEGEEKKKLIYYNVAVPLFENYFVQTQVQRALERKIWLKSGGFLIIEQTEACVVIDVNTGKYTGTKNLQSTIIKTNQEAAKEVAKQMKLRNLSGMIIVDFIDMKEEADRKALRELLENEVKKDRIKTFVVGMTELGLMQITRKKTSPSLQQILTTKCRCCDGTGRVYSIEWIVAEIRRQVISLFRQTIYNHITIIADHRLLNAFAGKDAVFLKELESTYGKKISLKSEDTMMYGCFKIEKEK